MTAIVLSVTVFLASVMQIANADNKCTWSNWRGRDFIESLCEQGSVTAKKTMSCADVKAFSKLDMEFSVDCSSTPKAIEACTVRYKTGSTQSAAAGETISLGYVGKIVSRSSPTSGIAASRAGVNLVCKPDSVPETSTY